MFGETPNLAARLQALAQPNQLIIDPVTKRHVGNAFDCTDLGTVTLKGFDTPVQAWQVLSSRESASRFESYRASHLTNFVGREQEVALLLGRWHEAVGGEGQVVLLCGEAGIGKSRIAYRLCDRLADENPQTDAISRFPVPYQYRALSGDQCSAGGCGTDQSGQCPGATEQARRHGSRKRTSRTRTRCHCWRICSRSRVITGTHRSRCHPKHART